MLWINGVAYFEWSYHNLQFNNNFKLNCDNFKKCEYISKMWVIKWQSFNLNKKREKQEEKKSRLT